MITKQYLENNRDSNGMVKVKFDVAWDQTSLGHLYVAIDKNIEGGKYINIEDATPISFDLEKKRVVVQLTLCVEDTLEFLYYEGVE